MNNTNKIIFACFLLVLQSCSLKKKTGDSRGSLTKNEKSQGESDSLDSIGYTDLSMPDAPPETKLEKEAPKAFQIDALNSAIKSQNDEKIYQTASQVLSQSPTDLIALNAMAMFHFKNRRMDAATFLLKKAISAHPESSEAYSNLGLIELDRGEKRKAIIFFKKALQLNPSNGIAAANLGSILVQAKDYSKALMSLEIAVSSGLKSPAILNNYAVALMANGSYQKSKEIFKQILSDSNKEIMQNYAILLIDHLHEYKEGLEIVSKLKFFGLSSQFRHKINALEEKARSGNKSE